MKPNLLLFLLFFVLTACTQYQYLTVTGVDIAKIENTGFVSENDTLKIQYAFSDYKGKVGISIHNKLNQPIEIDWKKSAIILDGKAISLFSSNAVISATIEQDSMRRRNLFANVTDPFYLASLNGSIHISEPSNFIPPASYIYKVPIALPLEQFQNLPEQSAKTERASSLNNVQHTYKSFAFEKEGSPLRFKSYLTFRTGDGSAAKEFTAVHHFYISEVWKTEMGPEYFPQYVLHNGDRFYLKP